MPKFIEADGRHEWRMIDRYVPTGRPKNCKSSKE